MTTKTDLSPMQQEILKRADNIFDSIAESVSKAASFASEQIPDIAFQYISFGRAYLTVIILISVFLGIVAVSMFRAIIKYGDVGNDACVALGFALGVGGIISSSIVACVVFLWNFKSFLMVWFAPKVWLITEMVKLATGK